MSLDVSPVAEPGLCLRYWPRQWQRMLAMARLYGWKPCGARPLPEDDADPDAEPCDRHSMWATYREGIATEEDARALAEAVERARPHESEDRIEKMIGYGRTSDDYRYLAEYSRIGRGLMLLGG